MPGVEDYEPYHVQFSLQGGTYTGTVVGATNTAWVEFGNVILPARGLWVGLWGFSPANPNGSQLRVGWAAQRPQDLLVGDDSTTATITSTTPHGKNLYEEPLLPSVPTPVTLRYFLSKAGAVDGQEISVTIAAATIAFRG